MAVGIFGKKLGMTQIFDEEGLAIPVTIVEAGPCTVTQIKTKETDGYTAIQIGYSTKKRVNKPEAGHLAKAGVETPLNNLKEYRVDDPESYELGQELTIENQSYEAGQLIDISGTTIGRGFAGYQKRHNFARGPMAHGSKNHRAPGSTGAGTTPGRIYPGKRMAGRYGGKRTTIRKLTVVRVDTERNLLFVKGAVPGVEGGLLEIRPALIVGR